MAKKLSVSPVGTAVFPRVTGAPDTKFDAAGVYSTKLRLDGAEAETLKAKLDADILAAVAQAKKDNPKKAIKVADAPYRPDLDIEGNETGATLFSFKLKAKGMRKDGTEFTQRPVVFDAKGKPLPQTTRVGGGSQIRVSYEAFQFYTATVGAGVSLRLKGVQVLDLKQGGDAASYGFDAVDGYTIDEDSPENEFTAAPAAPSAQSASDF